jgi:thiol:disulfide interchange protein
MRCFALVLLAFSLAAAESSLARFPGTDFQAASVAIDIELADRQGPEADLLVTFTPVVEPGGEPLHLYSKDLPKEGIDDVGRPTVVQIPDNAPWRARGEASVDPALPLHELSGIPVYPNGPVRLRLPVQLPYGNGAMVSVSILVTYMSCTDQSCNRPVIDRRLEFELPSDPAGWQPDKQAVVSDAMADGAVVTPVSKAEWAQLLTETVRRALRAEATAEIHWRHATGAEQVQQLIREAHQQGKAALLDFTGPSCANCQLMKKTVFKDPRVIAGWNAAVPIEIDTDASLELARWQRDRFGTEARPLYVYLGQDGGEERWSLVFAPKNDELTERFVAFLNGNGGADGGTGGGWWQFILLAIGGGLFTLLMPCTYPMIPLTVNFFAKQAADGRRLLPLALAYGAGIMACFAGLGLLVSFVIGGSVASFAGSPWTNLIIALVFVLLGLSLLGAYFLRLPISLQNRFAGGVQGGYLGALLMGLAFAITAFTCTAPFAGAVLAEGVRSGDALRPAIGMSIYASAIAIPFIALALSPGLLRHLPGAGSWMNEFKHVGGLVELAAALKFLAISDAVWGWGLIGRTLTLVLWAVIAAASGAYVLGWLRMEADDRVESVSVTRLLIGMSLFALALWFAAGVLGPLHLGVVESFFPRDMAP